MLERDEDLYKNDIFEIGGVLCLKWGVTDDDIAMLLVSSVRGQRTKPNKTNNTSPVPFFTIPIHQSTSKEMSNVKQVVRQMRESAERPYGNRLSDCDAELLQNAYTLLLILFPRQPEVVLVFHDVSQHRPTQEHHVLAPGRVLDPDLEFREFVDITL